MQTELGSEAERATAGVAEAVHWASDAATEAYYRAIEYTRENPRNAALIALGVGVGLGCLLGHRGGRRGMGSLLSTLAMAAGGAALDAYRAAE